MPEPGIVLVVVAAAIALALLLVWPDRGLLPRWRRIRHLAERAMMEDALKHIHKWDIQGRMPTLHSIAGALQISTNEAADVVMRMSARGLVEVTDDSLRLTPDGRDHALHIIRAHRLWERYLADETGFAETEWHAQAEEWEHALTPADVDALSARLGHPTHDSHGDPIPTPSGEFVSHGGVPLPALAVDQPARIVHLEDEPQAVYAQLVAEGLHVGQTVRLLQRAPNRVRFWADGDEHVVAPVVAANVSVQPLPDVVDTEPEPSDRLADLRPGEQAQVAGISRALRGPDRRRLMDLGFVPGTVVGVEMVAPSGDPAAYRVRGALIALRHDQARMIFVTRPQEAVA